MNSFLIWFFLYFNNSKAFGSLASLVFLKWNKINRAPVLMTLLSIEHCSHILMCRITFSDGQYTTKWQVYRNSYPETGRWRRRGDRFWASIVESYPKINLEICISSFLRVLYVSKYFFIDSFSDKFSSVARLEFMRFTFLPIRYQSPPVSRRQSVVDLRWHYGFIHHRDSSTV